MSKIKNVGKLRSECGRWSVWFEVKETVVDLMIESSDTSSLFTLNKRRVHNYFNKICNLWPDIFNSATIDFSLGNTSLHITSDIVGDWGVITINTGAVRVVLPVKPAINSSVHITSIIPKHSLATYAEELVKATDKDIDTKQKEDAHTPLNTPITWVNNVGTYYGMHIPVAGSVLMLVLAIIIILITG